MNRARVSPVGLAVLALLAEGPLHPYGMQRLIKDRAMDQVVNVRNRTGLHAAIARLARDGMIQASGAERQGGGPTRTVYELTREGRAALYQDLRDNLATPAAEFPLFPAVVSFLHLLTPQEARKCLMTRAESLQRQLDMVTTSIETSAGRGVARLHLLESEHLLAVTEAELHWVRGVVSDIAGKDLRWTRW